MKKTPEDRLKAGCSMFGFAKAIVIASIQEETGSAEPSNLKEKLFLRFYGNDMDEKSKRKIVAYFSNLKP